MFVQMLPFFFLSLLLTVGAQNGSVLKDPAASGAAAAKALHCGVSLQPLLHTIINNDGLITRGEFPWAAAIYKRDNGRWRYSCSGTLVSTHVVLTAAYCVSSPEGKKLNTEEIKVGLGKYNKHFDSNETDSIIADVREVVVPHNYHGEESNYVSDVALLDLSVVGKPTPTLNPACLLWQATTNISLDDKGYIAGWSGSENDPNHEAIKSWKMALFPQAACTQKLPDAVYLPYLTEDKICAERNSGVECDRGFSGAAVTSVGQGAHYVTAVLCGKITMTVDDAGLYLLTDMKHEGHVSWLRSELSRLTK